jgi:hypothetical protein
VRWGLLERRQSWRLSLKGKLLVLAIIASIAVSVPLAAYPFLAVTHPVGAPDTLIVEGWLANEMLPQAAYEFKRGGYRKLVVVRAMSGADAGAEYAGSWPPEEYIARQLVKHGVPEKSLGTVFFPTVERDRTYHAALAARDWFTQHDRDAKSFNVVTAGPHARRSWLLFRLAFGNTADVGIVALKDPTYDPKHWWRTSEGVREVSGEIIAFVYAKFFFVGPKSS